MNNRLSFFLLLLALALLTPSCQEETITPREYPRVRTTKIQKVIVHGAEVEGEIFFAGSSPIIDHGFLWGFPPDFQRLSLGPADGIGAFSATISGNLRYNFAYEVRAYAQTAEYFVQGDTLMFVSDVGPLPEISRIEPIRGVPGDTVRVIGKNFGDNISRVQVRFLPVYDATIVKVSNEEIQFTIPELRQGFYDVELFMAGLTFRIPGRFNIPR